MTHLANSVGWDVRNKPEFKEIENIVQEVIKNLGHKFSGFADDLIDCMQMIIPKSSRTKFSVIEVISPNLVAHQGHISQTRLRVQDVFAMTDSPTKILTQWNRNNQPVGDSSSLLAGFLGQVASNFGNFPANFVVNDVEHKQYILGSLGKKWKDKRCRLFDKFHKREQSVEENIENHPPHIPQDHWAIFVRYGRSAKTMEVMHGREFSRAEMYQVSHKKPDGSFVNEEAESYIYGSVNSLLTFDLQEKLQDELQNCSENEAFLRVCGKEHPGYVRGMGLGVSPSQVIGSSSRATSSTTSFESNERIEQMQVEINSLKAQVAEGTKNIKAIVLDPKEKISKCRNDGLSDMIDLRLLILYHHDFSGRFIFLSHQLRYLLWNGYPFVSLPSNFEAVNIVELNMPNSSINHTWKGCKFAQNFPYLKRIDLSNSRHLVETPDFSQIPKLERLDLSGCTNLLRVHSSIGLLGKLAFLSLRNCSNLVRINFDKIKDLI
ncbi:hypothetical protein Fmac_021500 [Flemingia macrophylla]|uniref:Uncharacterized protein n=1 Tax=Flemingia macrophylla TaxID=520843 RepID=A0ABD1LX35_9FABA